MHPAKRTARKDTLINTHIIIINRNLGHVRKRNRVLWKLLEQIKLCCGREHCVCSALFSRDLLSLGLSSSCSHLAPPGTAAEQTPGFSFSPHFPFGARLLWGAGRLQTCLGSLWLNNLCPLCQEDKCGAGWLSQERTPQSNIQKTQFGWLIHPNPRVIHWNNFFLIALGHFMAFFLKRTQLARRGAAGEAGLIGTITFSLPHFELFTILPIPGQE